MKTRTDLIRALIQDAQLSERDTIEDTIPVIEEWINEIIAFEPLHQEREKAIRLLRTGDEEITCDELSSELLTGIARSNGAIKGMQERISTLSIDRESLQVVIEGEREELDLRNNQIAELKEGNNALKAQVNMIRTENKMLHALRVNLINMLDEYAKENKVMFEGRQSVISGLNDAR